jgi:DNA helicase-2/ATP-dependent DNA helicase PcrA
VNTACGPVFEPTVRLLTEAACWQLADAVVRQYDSPQCGVSAGQASATAAVLDLAAALAEHLREPDDITRLTSDSLHRSRAPVAGGSSDRCRRY